MPAPAPAHAPAAAPAREFTFKRGIGLKFKVSAGLILLIALVMGGVTVVVRQRVQESLLEQIMVRGRALARGLAANAGEAVFTGDGVRLGLLVDQARRQDQGIFAVAVADANGLVLAHSDFRQERKPYERPATADIQKLDAGLIARYAVGGQEVLDFEEPIMLAGAGAGEGTAKPVGAAHVIYSLAPILKAVTDTLSIILVVAGAGLLVSIFLSLLMVNRITSPIRRLSQAAELVGTGELDIHLTVKRRDELGMLGAAFNHMASNLKRARSELIVKERLQNEMEIAQRIQNMLVPKATPKLPGYSVGMLYRAAEEVSGDYFDFIDLGKGQWGMTVADVSGKGVPGALVMAQTRSILRSCAGSNLTPARTLSRTNLLLYRDLPENMFVTLSYLILDTAKRTVTLSRGGHLAAIIYRAATRSCELEMPTGIAIGIADPETFDLMLTERSVRLAPGDFILMYTDGVDEATNPQQELFGSQRLVAALNGASKYKASGIVEFVDRAVQAFVGTAPQNDDITMILLKVDEDARA
jgi:serine phosphatase RsbU (regulator of sigma subunit)